jgi:3'-5' exoribonuclease
MPNDNYPLADYHPGDKLNRVLLAVRSAKACTDKNGKGYADLRVGDWSGSRIAKVWKVSEAEMAALVKASFVEITGDIDTNEQFAGDIRVNQYTIVAQPDDISNFIPQPGAANREHKKHLREIIQTVRDKELYNVLRLVFGPEEFRTKFSRAYAASSVHHAYAGGLLEHTLEVAHLCASAAEVLPSLDRNLLVTAALLHDIGKMEEMNQDLRAGEYTDEGVLIGHLVLGSTYVAQLIDTHNATALESEKISQEVKRSLMHLILSHHGEPQFGAAKVPVFAEACVLYYCDNISAKTRMYNDLIEKNTADETAIYNQFLGGRVYAKHPRSNKSSETTGNSDDFKDSDSGSPEFAPKKLPILGLVAAGSPDDKSVVHAEEFRFVVPPQDGADYLVQAVGDSMIDAGINPGDLLFVRKQSTAKEGDIVVANIAGEGQTVKRFRLKPSQTNGETPQLEAANASANYQPIEFNEGSQIQGKVTGLLREY